MRFVVLLHQDERVWAEADAEERARYLHEHDDFSAAAEATPGVAILGGEALTSVSAATTLRRRGDQVTITEGPYAETVEQLGGFYLVEAFTAATRRWPQDGVPTTPAAWLLTAARRRVVDHLRAEAVRRRAEPLMVVEEHARRAAHELDDPSDPAAADEDVMCLVLTCAHPALSPEARITLTLRFVVGLDVQEIARLLLLQEATVAARLTRAKKRLASSGIPFAGPSGEVDERLDLVATVLYLMFTSGYQPGQGTPSTRVDLAGEAIRLARLLDRAAPGHAVLRALLALMLLQHSRRDARYDDQGELVLLPDQDRERWDHDAVDEALRILDGLAPSTGVAEEYRLQGLVAAEHARATSSATTRWRVIATLYADLEQRTLSPLVRLARAVAVAECDGPAAGLALLEDLDLALPRHHRLPAVRAELLLRADRPTEAVDQLDRALALVTAPTERTHLERRRAHASALRGPVDGEQGLR